MLRLLVGHSWPPSDRIVDVEIFRHFYIECGDVFLCKFCNGIAADLSGFDAPDKHVIPSGAICDFPARGVKKESQQHKLVPRFNSISDNSGASDDEWVVLLNLVDTRVFARLPR